MFGMAMKFLELGLEPIIKATGSNQNQTITKESYQNNENKKPQVKSSEIIKVQSQHGQPQNSSANHQNIPDATLQELKQSQQKVLQDFKRSIERSIAFSHHQSQETKIQHPQGETYDLVQGIVLSKIQQLSQEYLEYSIRKQLTTFHLNQKPNSGSLNLDINSQNNKSSSSCDLIKSIVKSVLLPQSVTITEMSQRLSFEGIHLKQSSVKRSQSNDIQYNLKTNNNTGSRNSLKSSQLTQPVNEFIKELFLSLGLIQIDEKMSCSLKEMTQTARKKFNSLKGNDYVQKLNEMLKSVEGIDCHRNIFGMNYFKDENKGSQLKNSSSAPITASYNISTVPTSQTSQKTLQSKPKQRKQILIKRSSDRKVKLISPETLSQLQSKRSLIEKQINDALEFLTASRRVRKFSFYSKDINEVLLNFSYDFQFMSYKRVQRGFFTEANLKSMVKKLCDCTRTTQKQNNQAKEQHQTSMIPLKWNLVNIAKGLKTKNFIKFQQLIQNNKKKTKQPLHEDRCFSLLFRNRTYDFECESTAIRDEYFRAIKIMIKSTCDV